MDRFEAPNQLGANLLVMQSAISAEAWCADQGKRLCTEDEWGMACAGPQGFDYHGIFDMTGNIEEWVIRTKPYPNNYPHLLMGCYWTGCFGGSKPTCSSTNPAHDFCSSGVREETCVSQAQACLAKPCAEVRDCIQTAFALK